MDTELFKTKAVEIETLGKYLRQVREQLNFDIKTASILTQIKPIYLESLEQGDWNALPSDVYTRGFIRSLSRVYNLDEHLLIEQYEKEHGFMPQAQPNRQNLAKRRFRFTPRTIIVTASILLGVLAAGYVASQIRSVLAPPFLELQEPGADTTVQGNTLVVTGQAEIGADVTINEQIVQLDKNGHFTESLILSNGLNVIEVLVKNKFNKETKITRRINAEVPQTAVVAPGAPVTVTITVGPESTWIYLEADGVSVQRGTMLSGSTKTITASQEVLLTSANAGSTKVIYNGKDLGVMGREGEVIRNVEFTATPLQ